MKILVTGASGFIGNYVVNYLIENTNNEIYILSRDPGKLTDKSWHSEVNIIKGDIRSNKPDWYKFLEKPDKLIHLAWNGLPNYDKPFHLTENLIIKRHGYGKATFKDIGVTYEGNFFDNDMNGFGVAKWNNGAKHTGQWKLNEPYGQGKFIHPDGKIEEGFWNNGVVKKN